MQFLEFTFRSFWHFIGVCILAYMLTSFLLSLWSLFLDALAKRKDEE